MNQANDTIDSMRPVESAYRRDGRLKVVDLAICCGAVVVFVGYCLFKSPRRLFWTDEILTAVTVRGASFAETMDSLKDTINAMPPNYFVALWAWTRIFGTTDAALRAFSAVGVGVAWIFCWLLLRRFSSRLTASTATMVAMFCSQEIMDYDVEARCYTQYMAEFFAASWLLVLCAGRSPRPGWGLLAGAAVSHAMLVTTHYVGCVYSAALILAAAVAGVVAGERGLRQYALASLVGTTGFALCLPFYLAQRTLGSALDGPRRPKFFQLISSYDFQFQPTLFLVLLLLAGYALSCRYLARQRASSDTQLPTTSTDPMASAKALLGIFTVFVTAAIVPIGLWVESLVHLPLFLHRYLTPSFLIWPIALALALEPLNAFMVGYQGMLRAQGGRRTGSACLACVLMILIAAWPLVANRYDPELAKTRMVVEATRELGVDFASRSMLKAIPVLYYGGRAHWVEPSGVPLAESLRSQIFDVLVRRYGYERPIQSDQLDHGAWKLLVLRDEWDEWTEVDFPVQDWQIVKRVGRDLLLVERRDTPAENER